MLFNIDINESFWFKFYIANIGRGPNTFYHEFMLVIFIDFYIFGFTHFTL